MLVHKCITCHCGCNFAGLLYGFVGHFFRHGEDPQMLECIGPALSFELSFEQLRRAVLVICIPCRLFRVRRVLIFAILCLQHRLTQRFNELPRNLQSLWPKMGGDWRTPPGRETRETRLSGQPRLISKRPWMRSIKVLFVGQGMVEADGPAQP
jgi:hypothetical protein